MAPSAPVKVVLVSSHSVLGGSESCLEAVCEHLGPDWVQGVVALQDGPLVDRLQALGIKTEVIPTTGGKLDVLRRSRSLRKTLQRLPCDVVHANGVKAAAMVAFARPRAPFIWFKHDFSWDGLLGSWVARRAALVIGVSHAVLEPIRGGATARRVVSPGLIEQSASLEGGRAEIEQLLGRRPEAVVVLVGQFHPVKGHLDLIGSLRRVRQENGDVVALFIGGDDPSTLDHSAAVRARVQQLELDDAVVFAGYRADVARLLRGCDIGVVPSMALGRAGKEGFSLAALEMLGAGLPVVAYNHGGVPEVLGECGVLVPPGDVSALAQELLLLLRSREQRDRLSRCGPERVKQRFSMQAMLHGLTACYREVAGR